MNRARARILQQPAQSVDVGIHGFERVQAVVDRRRNAGRVDDVLEVGHRVRERVTHVEAREGEVVAPAQRLEPRRNAAHVVVEHGDVNPFVLLGPVVPVEYALDHVVAQESPAARDEHALARHARELVAEPLAHVVQVAHEQFGQRFDACTFHSSH
jgi:hypothetical protein